MALPLSTLRGRFRGELGDSAAERARASADASFVLGRAEAVAWPNDVDDVVTLVLWAREHRVPLTARGGGTSLDGESVPLHGGVVVDFARWTDVAPVDPVVGTVRVGPGVVNRALHDQLTPSGRFFPPNPGSWRSCSIGGNLATNASGPRSFRYGSTRRWVHSADVVLGTGERVTLGPSTAKRSLGPDLLDLVVGSEGTLGLVTSVTLRLATLPARRTGVVVPVGAIEPLAPLVVDLASRPSLRISAVEYVDARVAEALRQRPGARLPGTGPLVLLEVESDGEESEGRALEELDATLRKLAVSEPASVVADADRLWTLRGEAGAILDGASGRRIREDIAVPVRLVDRLLSDLRRISVDFGVELYVYGHLGQGNLHPNVVVDPESPKGTAVRRAIYDVAASLGGTVSGEHGVGSRKREFVPRELGPVGVRLLRGWKSLCDPDGILNPGKLLPDLGPATPSLGPSPSAGAVARTPPE
ncbi:MAG: FAD-binding oxidoreductase [Candidatus Lutacidiplasmatales archaeon]